MNAEPSSVFIVHRDILCAGDRRVLYVVESEKKKAKEVKGNKMKQRLVIVCRLHFCVPVVISECKVRVARQLSLHHLNLESLGVGLGRNSEGCIAVEVLWVVVDAVHQVGLHIEDLGAI